MEGPRVMNRIIPSFQFIRVRNHAGNNTLLAFGLLLFLSSVLFVAARAEAQIGRKRIQVFSLSDVRLLPGPFRHAQEMDERYLLELDPDRLLAPYFKTAGLKPKAEQYGGWESTQLSGAILGHYLSAASMMYAATGNPKLKERVDYIVAQLGKCQAALGTGYLEARPKTAYVTTKSRRHKEQLSVLHQLS